MRLCPGTFSTFGGVAPYAHAATPKPGTPAPLTRQGIRSSPSISRSAAIDTGRGPRPNQPNRPPRRFSFPEPADETSGGCMLLMWGASRWTPRALFANGEQGVWYDPSDFSTLFQDAAGTTPVTAVGQPVGKILDKSGRGNHATQSTTTSRPTLQQDASGFYYLNFDGVDDSLATAAINLSALSKVTAILGARKNIDTGGTGIVLEFGTDVASVAGDFAFYLPHSGTGATDVSFSTRGTATGYALYTNATVAAPVSAVFTGQSDTAAASVLLRVNGSQVATAISGTAANLGNLSLNVGRRNNAVNPFQGRIYQVVVRAASTAASELSQGERFCGSRMGIAL